MLEVPQQVNGAKFDYEVIDVRKKDHGYDVQLKCLKNGAVLGGRVFPISEKKQWGDQ